MIMGKESGMSDRGSGGQERTRDDKRDGRAERLFARRKLSSDLANVMKRDARNSASVSAPSLRDLIHRHDAPARLLSYPFFLFPSFSLSIYLCRWHDGTRFVVTLCRARAPCRADRFVAGNYGTRSGRHIACRTRVGALMRGLRDPPVPAPPGGLCVVRVSPGEVTRL